jgi:hypothetical protein
MAKDDLDAIAAEVAETVEPDPAEPAAEPVEVETVDLDEKALAEIMALAVGAVGGIVCSRAGVSPLAGDEIGALSGALVTLLKVYNVQANPKVAAWFGLVGTAAMVSLPRLAEFEARRASEAIDEKAPDLPRKGAGEGDPLPPPPTPTQAELAAQAAKKPAPAPKKLRPDAKA